MSKVMPGNDFGAFDKKKDRQLWLIMPKNFGSLETDEGLAPFVFVVGWTWISARRLAETYYYRGFDGFEGRLVSIDEGKVALTGNVVLVTDPKGGSLAFEATRSLDCLQVVRGEGLRVWERTVRQGGREDEAAPGGVQANGQEVVHPQGGDAPGSSDSSAAGGKNTDRPSRVRIGVVRNRRVGSAAVPTRGSGDGQ